MCCTKEVRAQPRTVSLRKRNHLNYGISSNTTLDLSLTQLAKQLIYHLTAKVLTIFAIHVKEMPLLQTLTRI